MRMTSLIAVLFAALSVAGAAEKANAGLFISITVAPPALPVYAQPPIPGPGYFWTPGYWAWDEEVSDYYWVPGTWVTAPEPGLLWTPGYWGWRDGVYVFNDGYWGPHIGFYGGVCYGYGYGGVGFAGGYWRGGSFFYNRSVANIGGGTVITNVYSKTVINNNVTNVSFNGGQGGVRAEATAEEMRAANERHIPPTKEQFDHRKLASQDRSLRASVNGGHPAKAATPRPGDFSHAIASKGATTGKPNGERRDHDRSLKQNNPTGTKPKTPPARTTKAVKPPPPPHKDPTKTH